MDIDYKAIGKRIAKKRQELGLKQCEVEEQAEIGYKYLSNIERGISIPSIEVIMRLSNVLNSTPDTFLVDSNIQESPDINNVSILLKKLNSEQLKVAKCFLLWLSEQEI